MAHHSSLSFSYIHSVMANEDPYVEIRNNISESTSLARDVDKKLEDLITLVINQEWGPDPFIVAFCYEIHVLEEFQQDRKNFVTDVILIFCRVGRDRMMSEFGDYLLELLPERGTRRRNSEMVRVMAAIEWFKETENKIIEALHKMTSIFQEKCSEGNFSVSDFALGSLGESDFDLREYLGVNLYTNLTQVMIQMYHFSPIRVPFTNDDILKQFREKFSDQWKSPRSDKATGFLIFQWAKYKENKTILEDLLTRMSERDKIDDRDKKEATERTMFLLYQMERVIASLVHSLVFSIGNVEMARDKLIAFEENLGELKQRRRYRVPVVVFWCMAFISDEIFAAVMNKEGASDSGMETFFKVNKLDDAIKTVEGVILQLVPVLNASALSNSSRLKKKVLLASFRVLQNCEMVLKSILPDRTS